MLTYSEFKATVKSMGLKEALYFARQLGVSLTQVQLWVRTK